MKFDRDPPAQAVPICRDCRFHRAVAPFPARCGRPVGKGFSLVNGPFVITPGQTCRDERERDQRGIFRKTQHCGPGARFFEPRK